MPNNNLDNAGAQLQKLGIDPKYLPKLLAYAKELIAKESTKETKADSKKSKKKA